MGATPQAMAKAAAERKRRGSPVSPRRRAAVTGPTPQIDLSAGCSLARAASRRRLLAPFSGVAVELIEMRLARLEALAAEIVQNKLRIEGVLAGEHAALTAICGVGPLHRGAPPRGDR